MHSNNASNIWKFRGPIIGLGVSTGARASIPKPQSEWNARAQSTMAGYPCIKHRVTDELAVFGRNGEIFEMGSGVYGVRIWSIGLIKSNKEIRKRIKDRYGDVIFKQGEEALLKIADSDLPQFFEILGAPKRRGDQLRYANKLGGVKPMELIK